MKVFYHPGFAAPLGKHIMPMKKFSLVAESLESDPQMRPHLQLLYPEPISEQDLLRVHTAEYVNAIRTGEPRSLAESQKFPWSPDLYPSVRLTNGGVLAAAEQALREGCSAALASGFHHAHQTQGEGFCTFNGLIIALETLKAKGLIQHAAILDMDLHYGNGTSLLVRDRHWIDALSIYGNDYWNNTAFRDVSILRHEDGPNHHSASLPNGCDRKTLLQIMEQNIPWLLRKRKPDLLLYQAGADPYREDPYSPLYLDHEDLKERDRQVFLFAKKNSIPIAWVLAGGYTPDLAKVVQVHTHTFQAWREVYRCESK